MTCGACPRNSCAHMICTPSPIPYPLAKGVFTLGLTLFLGACASSVPASRPGQPPVPARPGVSTPAPPPVTLPPTRFRKPVIMNLPGLERVIGSNASALARQFGTPRLDVREGDVRKLQFSGQPCVLDVYLYPYEEGGEPRASYVDARRESDGRDVDRASCAAALRK